MKALLSAVATVLALSSVSASGEALAKERVKTGILPSGGLYSIYAVACVGDGTAAVAAMDRRQRWCLERAGQLACYRDALEAADHACRSNQPRLADASLAAPDAGSLDSMAN